MSLADEEYLPHVDQPHGVNFSLQEAWHSQQTLRYMIERTEGACLHSRGLGEASHGTCQLHSLTIQHCRYIGG